MDFLFLTEQSDGRKPDPELAHAAMLLAALRQKQIASGAEVSGARPAPFKSRRD